MDAIYKLHYNDTDSPELLLRYGIEATDDETIKQYENIGFSRESMTHRNHIIDATRHYRLLSESHALAIRGPVTSEPDDRDPAATPPAVVAEYADTFMSGFIGFEIEVRYIKASQEYLLLAASGHIGDVYFLLAQWTYVGSLSRFDDLVLQKPRPRSECRPIARKVMQGAIAKRLHTDAASTVLRTSIVVLLSVVLGFMVDGHIALAGFAAGFVYEGRALFLADRNRKNHDILRYLSGWLYIVSFMITGLMLLKP